MTNASFVSKSSTPEGEKDLWETPPPLFKPLNQEFDFTLDVCASKTNALCYRFFTKEDNALEQSWSTIGAAWVNPPYSLTNEFISQAPEHAKQCNLTIVMLVNANTDTKWFADAAKTANEIRLITGRIGFINPGGRKANGNTKGQCLIIWRGKCTTPCQITMIDRDELMGKNNDI
jgi:phage N-6-adenine-methyltransferase